MAADLTQRPAWKALAAHYEQMRDVHLRTLFADDPARGAQRSERKSFPARSLVRELEAFPRGTMVQWYGPGQMIGIFPVAPGLVNWYATRRAAQGEVDGPGGRKRDVMETYRLELEEL